MSRSRKKNPFRPIRGDDSAMSKWKKQANRRIRRNTLEIPSGNHYKRIEDNRGSPRDGTQVYDPNCNMRK